MPSVPQNRAWVEALWDAPAWIKAGITTRHGGHSLSPYRGLNLATHVGDNPETVKLNRDWLKNRLALPGEPIWLDQIHGNRIIEAGESDNLQADGSYTDRPGLVCVILTADCVPLLLSNKKGTKVAAVHVGWRGYCAGIISRALIKFNAVKEDILGWIGPHIREKNYEVGDEVYAACIERNKNAGSCFTKSGAGRWNANLELLVRHELSGNNVTSIFSAGTCTYEQEPDFFSYRRENITGRMACMIWIEDRERRRI
jgi:polyphenol oxidase